jgi:hypothetical protein
MPDRVVKLGLASYVDPDRATRYALQGETVTVHPDDLKRFDEANGGAPPDTAPKKSRARSREFSGTLVSLPREPIWRGIKQESDFVVRCVFESSH